MKKYTSVVLSFFLGVSVVSPIWAATETSDRFKFDLKKDEEAGLKPEVFAPMYWGDNWFSGLGYKNNSRMTQNELDGFTDSKYSTSINENILRINILSYQSGSNGFYYSFGGDYQVTKIDKVEFGYFYLNNGVIDDYIAFDNNIDIEVSGLSFRGDITFGKPTDRNVYRLTAILSPFNTLNVSQSTDFKPIVPTTGEGSSSKAQDLSYIIQFETLHRFNSFMSIGLDFQYDVLPLDYDLLVLAPTADSFQEAAINTTETRMRAGLRFIFNYPVAKGLYPVVGVASENVAVEDTLNGGSESVTKTLFTLGFAGRF